MTTGGADTPKELRLGPARLLVLALLAAALVLLFVTGAWDALRPSALAAHAVLIHRFVLRHRLLAFLLFGLVYALATALSLPLGAVLSILTGWAFGPWWGTALVVLAATAGATALFVLARWFGGESLRVWLGRKPAAARLLEGFEGDAFRYLLALRLIPLFPFWLVNLAPAASRVRLRTYAAATLLGIVPGTFVFVDLGAGLRRLTFARTPGVGLFVALGLLGLLVFAGTLGRRWWRGREARRERS
jgi:uncharacterized membrane protein YdjX (TVP38/TMEM64 family)